MTQEFTHLDDDGRARMVDVSGKHESVRIARVRAEVQLNAETMRLLVQKALPKGEVSQAAAPQTFQNTPFDKGGNQPRVVMTLGDPESSEGSVETRTVQARHAHILEGLGWTQQGAVG